MKKLILAPVLALALLFCALASPASAHTPSGGATCDVGVFAKAENYNASENNSIGVQMDDQHIERLFDTSDYVVIAIPNDGKVHEWAWFVQTDNPDPSFSAEGYGKIRCGDRPQVKHAWVRVIPYCNTVRIEGRHNVSKIVRSHHGGRYSFKLTAAPGATFGDGSTHKVRHAHVKHTGCGHGSGS